MSVLSSLRARRNPGADRPAQVPTTTAAPAATETTPDVSPEAFEISPAKKHFFDTFGFTTFPGLFANDIDRITGGFEDIFEREQPLDTNVALHYEKKRSIIPNFIDKSEDLVWIRDDPRVVTIVETLLGTPYENADSDGNLFYCDTSWHPDTYASPLHHFHLKLSFYLDPLHGESGAIRMIPGTNHWQETYAHDVRSGIGDPAAIEANFGVSASEIPSWTVESEPGDVVVWSFRTVHASFNGGQRRRLFSVNFREVVADDA
jgi:hypothetical protein